MPGLERFAQAFAKLVVARPRTVLAVFLVVTGVVGWQARHFHIDASAETLLTGNDPVYRQTRIVDERFGAREFLLLAYRPREGPLWNPQTLADLREMKRRFRDIPRVESVHTVLDVPLPPDGASLAGDSIARWTFEGGGLDARTLASRLRGHPLYEGLLVNRDQTATALHIVFRPDPELQALDRRISRLQQRIAGRKASAPERRELGALHAQAEPIERRLDAQRAGELTRIRLIANGFQHHAETYIGGAHALGSQLVEIVRNDLIVFGTAIGLAVCLILFLLFRSMRWVLIPVVCCTCSVLTTLGLFGLLGFKATVVSSSFVALQLILTLALCIHLTVQYREYGRKHPDWDQSRRVREALARKAVPVFYAGFTNIVGFASLWFCDIQPIVDFGWMMSTAMLISISTSLVLFPAMMILFRAEPTVPQGPLAGPMLRATARLAHARPRWIVAAAAIALVAGGAGIVRLEVENSFVNYFDESTDVHRELTFIDREFGGTTPLDLTYTIPRSQRQQDLVLTAEAVQTLQGVQAALENRAGVGQVVSVVNLAELGRRLNHGRPLTEYELTALYLTMRPQVREDLFGSLFAPDANQLRIAARVADTTPGLNRGELIRGIRSDLQQLGVSPDQYSITNLFVLYQGLLDRLYASQILTLGLSFGVLALAALAIFRSIPIALICIAPNVLSTVAVLGLMGWIGIPLDFMTIMIASIALGISVDDTIHYIDRYLEERTRGNAGQAVEETHMGVGYALAYTSLIVVLGFSLLAFSDFVPSVLFGLLTALAMALAVLFDFTLVPVLLDSAARLSPASRPATRRGTHTHQPPVPHETTHS